MTARTDSVNAVLSTLQATITSGFSGMAEIDVNLTDVDHTTDSSTPLVSRTLYIPVTATGGSSGGPVVTAPVSLDYSVSGLTPTPFNGLISVDDDSAHVIDMGVRVFHGQLTNTAPGALPVQLLQGPQPTTMTPPGAPAGTMWTASSIMVRGSITGLNSYLDQLGYTRLDTWGTVADTVADDYVQITLDDRATSGNPVWNGDQLHRTAQSTVPILYIT